MKTFAGTEAVEFAERMDKSAKNGCSLFVAWGNMQEAADLIKRQDKLIIDSIKYSNPEQNEFTKRMRAKYGLTNKKIDKIKPGHGPCCTCQECGYHHDDCKCCDNDRIEAYDIIDNLNAERCTLKAENDRLEDELRKTNDEIQATRHEPPEPDFQITIDMLMDKKEQTRIGINPDDVEHKREINQILCRILEEYDQQKKQINDLEKKYQEYTTGKDNYYHDVWCNASRKEPMGCDGCSCIIGRKLKKQAERIDILNKQVEYARKDSIEAIQQRNLTHKYLKSILESGCFISTKHPRYDEWFKWAGEDKNNLDFDEWLINEFIKDTEAKAGEQE